MATDRTSRSDVQRLLASGAGDAAVCDAFERMLTSLNGPTQAAHRFAVACFISANRPHLAEQVLRYPIELLHSQCQLDNVEWFSRAGAEFEAEWGAEAGRSGVKWAREELPKLLPLLERLLWEGAAQYHFYPGTFVDPPLSEELWFAAENPGDLHRYVWRQRPLSNREYTATAAAAIRAAERLFPAPDAFRYVTELFDVRLTTGADRAPENRPPVQVLSENLRASGEPLKPDEDRALAESVRDIFGNRFRPVGFSSAWRTSDAVLLARGIHNENAFDRMPILADALQDAGCDNEDILGHCRDARVKHVRGCWVIAQLLDLT